MLCVYVEVLVVVLCAVGGAVFAAVVVVSSCTELLCPLCIVQLDLFKLRLGPMTRPFFQIQIGLFGRHGYCHASQDGFSANIYFLELDDHFQGPSPFLVYCNNQDVHRAKCDLSVNVV